MVNNHYTFGLEQPDPDHKGPFWVGKVYPFRCKVCAQMWLLKCTCDYNDTGGRRLSCGTILRTTSCSRTASDAVESADA